MPYIHSTVHLPGFSITQTSGAGSLTSVLDKLRLSKTVNYLKNNDSRRLEPLF